jgi:hypothetical protein
MKCFEIRVNDGEPTVAGAEGANLLTGSLFLASSGKGGIVVSARVAKGPARTETLEWVSERLAIGDKVLVTVVESENPTQAIARSLHGTAVDPEAPDLSCSICKRSRPSVEKLLAVGAFSICDECVELCHSTLNGAK